MSVKKYYGCHSCEEIDSILNQAEKTAADVDYIAMMSDIDIDPEEEDENNEQEVSES